MTLEAVRLFFDFGLVVLIWLVQLVAYPAFQHMEREQLRTWHARYSIRISLLVIPLMLCQLAVSLFQMIDGSLLNYLIALLVGLVWLQTFSVFVPLHKKIAAGYWEKNTVKLLVDRNWWRTFLWTAVFLLALFDLRGA